ncbi:1-phosphatidylinositol-3-phosphate 5-kinase [Heracleum sosnowskyi]|uniref:1-phosphatidylinositol-3-phosphate 5-kinase n=1 Tax=Heracleum sosnowskyi TaxID=360622 RepID=A0AAD8I0V1_9APIA|nr:1-phosphatidylinositol-3-phosphate 5-kinase [Heracleum sosnowskyi]
MLISAVSVDGGGSSGSVYESDGGWERYGPRIGIRNIKPIRKGEEITIAYTNLLQTKCPYTMMNLPVSYLMLCFRLINYASPNYLMSLKDQKIVHAESSQLHSFHSSSFLSFHSTDETMEPYRSLGSADEVILFLSGSRSSLVLDPLSYTKAFQARVSFGDDGPLGKVKYTVIWYYAKAAKRFEALRKLRCPSEIDYIKSLSRCKKWGAQGGKSNVFFAKTLDDRFIIKQFTKTELESFVKFAPEYFEYLSESISTRSPTCLAKVLAYIRYYKLVRS